MGIFSEIDELMLITGQDHHFAARYWNALSLTKGFELFADNLVSGDMKVQADRAKTQFQFTGSVYDVDFEVVSLQLHTADRKLRRVSTSCTCRKTACRHGFAMFLQILEYIPEAKSGILTEMFALPNALDQWLQEVATVTKKPVTKLPQADSSNNFVIYLLYVNSDNELRVEPAYSRILKTGGYGKPSNLNIGNILSGYHANKGATLADLEIFRYLQNNEGSSYSRYYINNYIADYKLSGALGSALLRQIVASGRAFWNVRDNFAKTDTPLQLGSSRELQISWQQEGSEYLFSIRTTPEIDEEFLLHELYYVDYANNQIGELVQDRLPPELLMQFLYAPPIPVAEAEKVGQKLLDILPQVDIPTPTGLEQNILTVDDTTPRPQLRLKAVDEGDRIIHCGELSFSYGGKTVQTTDATNRIIIREGNSRYRIERDLQQEQQAPQQLAKYHLHPVPDNPNFSPFDYVCYAQSDNLSLIYWDNFLSLGIAELEQQGWQISFDDSFIMRFDTVEGWDASIITPDEEDAGWFELTLGFEIDGQRVNLLPILVDIITKSKDPQQTRELLLQQEHMMLSTGKKRWAKIETKRIAAILDTLIELYDKEPLNKDGNLSMLPFQGSQLGDLLRDPSLRWKGAEELQQLHKKLQDFAGIENVALPTTLQAEPRHYQQDGLNWLNFLREMKWNGVLADDMGLGKTLQAIMLLLLEKEQGRAAQPSLVIAPTSLMSNWRREVQKFAPTLRAQVVHGTERQQFMDQLEQFDLIITTYPLMLRDYEYYSKQKFHYLILDEAQAIKNAKAKTTQLIYQLQANHRLCLTGTPMENHLGELWSMFHFLMPGFLGDQERFTRLFRTPIEKQGNSERQKLLRKRLQPFMLRRTKDIVATELPVKTEIIRTVPLEGKQRDLYETVRVAMDEKVRKEISNKGFARSQIMILDALLKLRQTCCDPRLLKLDQAKKVTTSAKLDLLMEMLPEMVEEGRKILLFSQFTSMLTLIEAELSKAKISYSKLTGATRKREEVISAFQDGDASVFLISLKAGGTGLNLTAADTVIHYDPWWNPAVEQQATDRAYRLGQDKPVFVYKLLTEETVEEKILAMQQRKKSLADGVYSDKTDQGASFSQDDLLELLKPLA